MYVHNAHQLLLLHFAFLKGVIEIRIIVSASSGAFLVSLARLVDSCLTAFDICASKSAGTMNQYVLFP